MKSFVKENGVTSRLDIIQHTLRRCHTLFALRTFNVPEARLQSSGSAPRDPNREWSRLRLRVLRRDRYRCRGCDRRGDEVTLEVYSLTPECFDISQSLTLCVRCSSVSKDLSLAAGNIPELLRRLWRHLHHPDAVTLPHSSAELSSNSVSGEALLLRSQNEGHGPQAGSDVISLGVCR